MHSTFFTKSLLAFTCLPRSSCVHYLVSLCQQPAYLWCMVHSRDVRQVQSQGLLGVKQRSEQDLPLLFGFVQTSHVWMYA